jgi:predicted nucleic acid-binding protein
LSAYVESSAAGKLLLDEPESAALKDHLDLLRADNVDLVSSRLLETELRRIAIRHDVEQLSVPPVLNRMSLVVPPRSLFFVAGTLPGRYLRSLDALHVATAVRLDVQSFITYDNRQAEAARAAGLPVVAPGR